MVTRVGVTNLIGCRAAVLAGQDRNVRRILVRGVNAPLPPEAKKILKI